MKSKVIQSRSKVDKNAEAFAKEQIREEAHHFCRLESALASIEINLRRSETEFDEPKEIELSERERERERERNVFICIVRKHGVNTMRMNEPMKESGVMQFNEITKMPLDPYYPVPCHTVCFMVVRK